MGSRSFGARPTRGTARPAPRRRSLVGTVLAYLLVGAFVGIIGWKLADTAAEALRMRAFERPDIVVAAPSYAPSAFADDQLAEVLRRHVGVSTMTGAYVKNLTTGAQAHVNAERVFPAASLYKLPILAEVVRQVRLRRISPDQELTVGREHWVAGSGVLQARVGQSLPVRELMRLLVVESDNIAAMMLLDLVGLENVNQTMQGMGLRSTRLTDYRSPGAYSGTGPYITTPADVGLLLEIVATGRLVDPAGSEEALRLLERKQASEWLGEGLPWWVKIAHKWGDVPNARYDAGIVFTPRSQYVVVAMTEGLDPTTSAAYIRDVSRAVFNYFERSR